MKLKEGVYDFQGEQRHLTPMTNVEFYKVFNVTPPKVFGELQGYALQDKGDSPDSQPGWVCDWLVESMVNNTELGEVRT